MATAKAQVNDKRLEAVTNKESYLGEPPTDRELIRVSDAITSPVLSLSRVIIRKLLTLP